MISNEFQYRINQQRHTDLIREADKARLTKQIAAQPHILHTLTNQVSRIFKNGKQTETAELQQSKASTQTVYTV